MGSLALAASSSTKSIQLGRQLGLRLDERAAVITHRLVASVGVLGEERKSGRNQKHHKKDKRKGGVDDEEDDSHDSSDDGLFPLAITHTILEAKTYGLLEDFREHQQEE
jgi:hypothetical protein